MGKGEYFLERPALQGHQFNEVVLWSMAIKKSCLFFMLFWGVSDLIWSPLMLCISLLKLKFNLVRRIQRAFF